ncbi:MAG: ATP phosphoribosyltransferase regulatory subunit [Aquificae bacterium]|nr:ATP phosphoribosyltransferase regulatory subunit [Aquificota bacterium]
MIDLPAGVKVFNRKETAEINSIVNSITDTFEKWGYQEIRLPFLEYYTVHSKALGEDIGEKTFKLVDRSSGDILTLRADFTAQIGRYFASLKRKRLPKRYYYKGTIFRYTPPKGDNLWERIQAGIELIGSDSLHADGEVIALAVNSVNNLGMDNFWIDINNTKLFSFLKEELKLSDEEYNTFMESIKGREFFSLRRFVSKRDIPTKLKEFIVSIPKLQGDISLIKDLQDVYQDFPTLVSILEQLNRIYTILKDYQLEEKVRFDLGEPKEFSYYTGIVFEVFGEGYPKPIGQGGRYDSLISKYNGNTPATGFAFDIYNLWQWVKNSGKTTAEGKKDFFLVSPSSDKSQLYTLARALREKGYTVGVEVVDRPVEQSIKDAFEDGYRKVILFRVDTQDKGIYIYSSIDKAESISIQQFLEEV